MCQYCSADGLPDDWHLVHLGRFAIGGAGLVMTEATAVSAVGRSTPVDTGIWNEEQERAWARVVDFVHAQGAAAGIQLGHAGRKASTTTPWEGATYVDSASGGWTAIGPSPVAFGSLPKPVELDQDGIAQVVEQFGKAAQRALRAGFDVVELHAAHGYLLHEFLSPLANQRADSHGGSLENRARLLLTVAEKVREIWPDGKPVFVRISGTDWVTGGWDLEQSVQLASWLAEIGIDLVDCSTGGMVHDAQIPVAPGYQVGFAEEIRRRTGIATAAVGLITDPQQADDIVRTGAADAVFMAKELLRQPNWPLLAADTLGVDLSWPDNFASAKPRRS